MCKQHISAFPIVKRMLAEQGKYQRVVYFLKKSTPPPL